MPDNPSWRYNGHVVAVARCHQLGKDHKPSGVGMEGLDMIKQAGVASLLFSAFVSFGAGAHHSRTAFFHICLLYTSDAADE